MGALFLVPVIISFSNGNYLEAFILYLIWVYIKSLESKFRMDNEKTSPD